MESRKMNQKKSNSSKSSTTMEKEKDILLLGSEVFLQIGIEVEEEEFVGTNQTRYEVHYHHSHVKLLIGMLSFQHAK